MSDQDVVVIGYLPSMWMSGEAGGGSGFNPGGPSGPNYVDNDTAEGGGTFVGNMGPWYPAEERDEDEVRIDLNVSRELTGVELAAFERFTTIVRQVSDLISTLPDTAKMTLSGGREVTGAEIKQIWSKLDFTINDVGESYQNMSYRGEANYNGGDPQVSFNISTLQDYHGASAAGAMEFLPLHEVGHLTLAGRDFNDSIGSDGITASENRANEQIANDVARALAHAGEFDAYIDPFNGNGQGSSDFLGL